MQSVTIQNGSTIPFIVKPGEYIKITTNALASGTASIAGEAIADTLIASSGYAYGGFSVQREVVVRLTSGAADVMVEGGNPPVEMTRPAGGSFASVVTDPAGLAAVRGANGVEFSQNIIRLAAKLAATPVRQSSILFAGHSIVAGVGSDDTTGTSAESTWATNALPVAFSRRLNAALGGTYEVGAKFVGPDQQSLWTLAGGASFDTQFQSGGIGGYRLVLANATQTATISLTGTTVIVYGAASATGAKMQYQVDGGAVTDAPLSSGSPNPASGYFYSFTITGLSNAAHSIKLIGSAATTFVIYSAEGRTQTAAGVVVHRAGLQSMSLPDIFGGAIDATDTAGPANWIGAGGAGRRATQPLSVTTAMGADGVIFLTDVNDLVRGWTTYGWTLADIARHVANTIAFCATNSLPVLFVCGPWRRVDTYGSGCPFTQDQVVAVYRAACAASTNAAFVDMRTLSYSATSFDGTGPGLIVDHVHPTKIGASAYGSWLANVVAGSVRA